MTFKIIRSDITWADADAIVVAANEFLSLDAGTSRAVALVAGYDEMSAACRAIGWCDPGKAVVTPSFDFGTKCIIHAVAPVWGDGCDEDILLLESAYDAAFDAALKEGCVSVALPLLGAGNLRWPADISLDIAVERAKLFLEEHDMRITLYLYDDEAYEAGHLRFPEIISFIESAQAKPDLSAVEETVRYSDPMTRMAPKHSAPKPRRYGLLGRIRQKLSAFSVEREVMELDEVCREEAPKPLMGTAQPCAAPTDINEWLDQKDAGFTETLLALIDEKGLDDAQVYKRANMSRQLFSKIRSNPDYRPKKPTALALCIALELDLAATEDLLARAGLALNPSDTFDLIVKYHILNGIYDSFVINEVLFAFDCRLLG